MRRRTADRQDTVGTARGSRMRTARSRGAVSGLMLILLGVWGALIPLVGPYAHFGYAPDRTWDLTSGRFWLEVLPGIVTVLAGLLLVTTAQRVVGVFASLLGIAAGAWFVIGVTLSRLWTSSYVGKPLGGSTRAVVEILTMFTGLGALIVGFSALALGRFTVVAWRDVAHAGERGGRVAEGPVVREEPVLREERVVREEPVMREERPIAAEREGRGRTALPTGPAAEVYPGERVRRPRRGAERDADIEAEGSARP